MNNKKLSIFIGLLLIFLTIPALAQLPALINYQGNLVDGNVPVTDNKAITFAIYSDTMAASTALWTETHSVVTIQNGLFQVLLGSVSPFPSGLFSENGALYLGLSIDGADELQPRSQVTSVAGAIYSLAADSAKYAATAAHAAIADTALHTIVVDSTSHAVTADTAGFAVTAMHAATATRATIADSIANSDDFGDGHSLNSFNRDSIDVVFVNDTGNVGIGTIFPTEKLDIHGHQKITGSIGTSGLEPLNGLPAGWFGGLHTHDVYAEFTVGAGQGGELSAFMNSDGQGYFAGPVGIGTFTPQSTLDVNGVILTKGLNVQSPFAVELGAISTMDEGAEVSWHGAPGYENWRTDVFQNSFRIFSASDTANQVQIFSTGSKSADLYVQGNVGIGTTTPEIRLSIQANSGRQFSANNWIDVSSHGGGIGLIGSNAYLDDSDNNFHYSQDHGTIGAVGFALNTPLWNQAGVFANNGGSIAGDTLNPNWVMIWDSNGKVGIGTTEPTEALHVVGNICYTGSSGACSDSRYKTNFNKLTSPLKSLSQISGLYYHWRTDAFPDKKFSKNRQIGVIAQEVEKMYPELVLTDENGYKSVDYAKFTPILIEAVKEQQETINTQNDEVSTLRIENKELRAEVTALKENFLSLAAQLQKLEKQLEKEAAFTAVKNAQAEDQK